MFVDQNVILENVNKLQDWFQWLSLGLCQFILSLLIICNYASSAKHFFSLSMLSVFWWFLLWFSEMLCQNSKKILKRQEKPRGGSVSRISAAALDALLGIF